MDTMGFHVPFGNPSLFTFFMFPASFVLVLKPHLVYILFLLLEGLELTARIGLYGLDYLLGLYIASFCLFLYFFVCCFPATHLK